MSTLTVIEPEYNVDSYAQLPPPTKSRRYIVVSGVCLSVCLCVSVCWISQKVTDRIHEHYMKWEEVVGIDPNLDQIQDPFVHFTVSTAIDGHFSTYRHYRYVQKLGGGINPPWGGVGNSLHTDIRHWRRSNTTEFSFIYCLSSFSGRWISVISKSLDDLILSRFGEIKSQFSKWFQISSYHQNLI